MLGRLKLQCMGEIKLFYLDEGEAFEELLMNHIKDASYYKGNKL